MTRLNSLLHRPWPMRVVLQKFLVMIRLDYERAHLAQSLDDHLCHITEVGNKTQAACAGLKDEPQGINRVVRDRKGLHRNVANRKLGTSREDPPVSVSPECAIAAHRFCRQRIAINRHVKFPAKDFKPADMVAVFVREKHAIELLRCYTTLFQAQYHLSSAETAVDENLAMIRCDQGAVSRTPAAKHGQAEHGI